MKAFVTFILLLTLSSCKKDQTSCINIECGNFEDQNCLSALWRGTFSVEHSQSYNHSTCITDTNSYVSTSLHCLTPMDTYDITCHMRLPEFVSNPYFPEHVAYSLYISNSNLYVLSFENTDTSWVAMNWMFVPQSDTCTFQFGSDFSFYLDDISITPL